MSISKTLFEGVALSGTTTLATAPGGGDTDLGSLMLHNQTSSPIDLAVHIVANGSTLDADNRFMKKSLLPDETFKPSYLIGEPLPAGYSVQLSTTAADTVNYRGWLQIRSA